MFNFLSICFTNFLSRITTFFIWIQFFFFLNYFSGIKKKTLGLIHKGYLQFIFIINYMKRHSCNMDWIWVMFPYWKKLVFCSQQWPCGVRKEKKKRYEVCGRWSWDIWVKSGLRLFIDIGLSIYLSE